MQSAGPWPRPAESEAVFLQICSGLGLCVHVHVHVCAHTCDYSRRLPRVRLPSLAGLFFSAYSLSHNFQNY